MSETTRQPISRRTVAKGAAWSAPVILGGVAAPTYAASGGSPTLSIGGACKAPGKSCKPFEKGYVVTLTITNDSDKDVWLYVPPTITTEGTDLNLGYAGYDDGSGVLQKGHIPIPANDSRTIKLNATNSNSANQVFKLTLTFAWGHTPDPADGQDHDLVSATTTIPGTPPDCCN